MYFQEALTLCTSLLHKMGQDFWTYGIQDAFTSTFHFHYYFLLFTNIIIIRCDDFEMENSV